MAEAPDFTGARVAPDSGLHLDPERRALGCWTPSNCPEAYDLSSRWPGWAIDFWRDDRTRRLAAAPGAFTPPTIDPSRARAEVLRRATE